MNNLGQVLLLIAIFIIAVIGVVYLTFATKRRPILDQGRYQTHWLELEHALQRDNPASWQLAIMNADKLLDQALRERRFGGKTMGERMKAAQSVWKNANHVWSAHKIRNQLAHETNAHVSYEITLRALAAYKQGLKDLGAI
jgi:hypothetical protein